MFLIHNTYNSPIDHLPTHYFYLLDTSLPFIQTADAKFGDSQLIDKQTASNTEALSAVLLF